MTDVAERRRTLLRSAADQVFHDEYWSEVACSMARSMPLFVPGAVGTAATAAVNALDNAGPDEDLRLMAVDLSLGAARGLLLRGLYRYCANANLGVGQTGFALGAASRGFELGFDRRNYFDTDGRFSLVDGFRRAFRASSDGSALAAEASALSLASTVGGAAQAFSGGLLSRSPFFGTVATGLVYGLSYGAVGEVQREYSSGESINFWKVIDVGRRNAVISGISAIPGALIAQHDYNDLRMRNLQELQRLNKQQERSQSMQLKLTSTGYLMDLRGNAHRALDPSGDPMDLPGGKVIIGANRNGFFIQRADGRAPGFFDSSAIKYNGKPILIDGRVRFAPNDLVSLRPGSLSQFVEK